MPGGHIQLNPLERIGSDEQRQALLHAVARAILARELHQYEAVGLTAALGAVDARKACRDVCIGDVVAELREPSDQTAREMNVPPTRARHELRDCALALHRLCAGPLRGMFDGPTNAGEATWKAAWIPTGSPLSARLRERNGCPSLCLSGSVAIPRLRSDA